MFNGITDLIQSSLIPTRQSTLIEVPIGAAVGQNQGISFGNQNTLLDKCVITSIEVFYAEILSKSPSNRPLIPQADLNKLTVSLCDTSQGEDFYWMKNQPIRAFATSLNSGILKQVYWRLITPNKCKLNVVDTSVTLNTSVVFMMNYWTVDQYYLLLTQMGYTKQANALMAAASKR